ncbi:hypothetical protein SAMN06265371_103210 [Lutibacter agarilyticus]|uniref:Acetyltransferase (GNAT) domain-containing protein n=1 Tax=Lutibacter agarilyticus TaxID=1109740 RepID=A0A238WJG0_9FLAO|nr:hypothetical protein [Lutibacter agarilyticus]SNR45809.1 hypothetical protein SAMN06265371_103210 [Lutibacter agarilyticus]
MIHYLKRNQLDIQKYDACVQSAINSRIYAYSWYLDSVADNWDALILNDYEAVMPLPWRQKYFIKYIYPPAWTQQLGVFSAIKTSEDLVLKFIKAIPRKFKKVTIQFNSENKFQHKNLTERVNYILSLNKPYEEIYKGFNKNRKRVLKKTLKLNSIVDEEISSEEFLDFYLNTQKNYQLGQDQITIIKNLLNSNNERVCIWGIRESKKLIAGLVWLKEINRITYLLPIATIKAKEKGLPTLLISTLIGQYQNKDLVLDFEGSMIEGVAEFYKSFGRTKEKYIVVKMSFFY